MLWRGFVVESKSYMDHPDCWEEWKAQLYYANGDPDPNYPGWTMADKRKATLNFWRKFPRAWIRFHWSIFADWLKALTRATLTMLKSRYPGWKWGK